MTKKFKGRRRGLAIKCYPACCKIDVVCEFQNLDSSEPKWTDQEWLYALTDEQDSYDDGSTTLYGPIIAFSHSAAENEGVFTPWAFAEWLKERGEQVTSLQHEHMTAYYCAPSKKFWDDLEEFREKIEKEDNENDDGSGEDE